MYYLIGPYGFNAIEHFIPNTSYKILLGKPDFTILTRQFICPGIRLPRSRANLSHSGFFASHTIPSALELPSSAPVDVLLLIADQPATNPEAIVTDMQIFSYRAGKGNGKPWCYPRSAFTAYLRRTLEIMFAIVLFVLDYIPFNRVGPQPLGSIGS